jgi:hypothetical protein
MTVLPQYDRNSPEYKRELYICVTIVVVLSVVGGLLLGFKISRAEAARESGEYEKVRMERQGTRPGIEQGIIN